MVRRLLIWLALLILYPAFASKATAAESGFGYFLVSPLLALGARFLLVGVKRAYQWSKRRWGQRPNDRVVVEVRPAQRGGHYRQAAWSGLVVRATLKHKNRKAAEVASTLVVGEWFLGHDNVDGDPRLHRLREQAIRLRPTDDDGVWEGTLDVPDDAPPSLTVVPWVVYWDVETQVTLPALKPMLFKTGLWAERA